MPFHDLHPLPIIRDQLYFSPAVQGADAFYRWMIFAEDDPNPMPLITMSHFPTSKNRDEAYLID